MSEPDITSRHNPRLKRIVKLREGRERRRTGQLLVDGAREVLRALQSGIQPVEALLDIKNETDRTQQAVTELQSRDVPILTVASDLFAKIAFGDRADGLILIAESGPHTLDDLTLPTNALVAVVEGVEKPGNLGAILRTTDGAGVDAVILADSKVDLYNPNTIRASIGTLFRKNIAVATSAAAHEWLAKNGLQIVVGTPEATKLYHHADMTQSTAIVLGSEALGVTEEWRREDVTQVAIPMAGVADSLNVSVTAAILLYEARRQRDRKEF